MIRSLLKLGLLLLVAIVVYNRFFGTDEEKEQSKRIFKEVKSLATSTVDLVRAEKEKYKQGKYDKVMSQLGTVYAGLRDKAKFLDENVLRQLDDLEKRKASLEKDLDQLENEEAAPVPAQPAPKKGLKRDAKAEETTASKAADLDRRRAELQRQLDQLARETQQLTEKAEKQLE